MRVRLLVNLIYNIKYDIINHDPTLGVPRQRNRDIMALNEADIDHARRVLSGKVTLKELASDTSRRKTVATAAILYGADCAAELAACRTTLSELFYELTVRPGLAEADKPRIHEKANDRAISDKLVPLSRQNGLHAGNRTGNGIRLLRQPLFDALFAEDAHLKETARELFTTAMTTINARRSYAAGVAGRTRKMLAALKQELETSPFTCDNPAYRRNVSARQVKEARDALDRILRTHFPEL